MLVLYSAIAGHSIGYASAIAALSLPFWPVLYAQQGLFQARHVSRHIEELRRLVNATLMGVVLLAGISVILQVTLSRGWLLTAA